MPSKMIKSYKDMKTEIEIWEDRLESYEVQKKALEKMSNIGGPKEVTGIDYSTLRVDGGSTKLDYGEYLDQVKEIENHIFLHKKAIDHMKENKKKIEAKLKKLEGIDYKVVYMRDIEEMQLQDIANQLNYSLIYIQKVSARNRV